MRMSKTSSSPTLTLVFLLLHYSAAITTNSLELLPSVTFASFGKPTSMNFSLSESSSVNGEALQITPDSSNTIDYLVNKSGRIIYNKPFTLWNLTTTNSTTTAAAAAGKKYVASFNTSFTVNVFRPRNASTVGEGLAFLIAPSLDGPPLNSHGGYLGLTNATLDDDESNHFVAIELDTSKQSYDPDDNHVGLNINTVVSNATSSLTPLGIQISPENKNAPNYTIWIDYDGRAKRIYVYMDLGNRPKPARTVLDAALDIGDHVLEKSYFGFAGSTGTAVELNCVLSWNLTVEKVGGEEEDDYSSSSPPVWKWVLAIGLPVVAVAVILGLFWMVKRKKVEDDPSTVLLGKLKSLPGTPREFEFKVLKKATNNFDEKMKLGQGGFGVVYKALVPGEDDTVVPVAVKKFSRDSIKGQDDFLQELIIINRLRHKHLVRLVGWCHKNDMLLLVYECMPNGSLDSHLFGDSDQHPSLSWSHRYNILTGVASALRYLHNEFDQMVVHRDLKASNVLLDSNFNAKLGDFGLARAIDTDKTSYVDVELGGVPGTMGYIAPECFHTGKTTRESDVYAFGAVVLEVVCGRRPRCDIGAFQFLTDWVWMLHREGRILEAVDLKLGKDFVEDDAVRLLLLGLACSHPLPKERPLTAEIVQNISRSVAPVTVPPFKPAFVWPSMMPDTDGEGTTGNFSSKTSIAMTSSPYASSAGWTPRADDMSDH